METSDKEDSADEIMTVSQVNERISFEMAEANNPTPSTSAKVRGRAKEWNIWKTFNSKSDGEKFIKGDKSWAIKKRREVADGFKVFYRCKTIPKKGVQCNRELYLFLPHNSTKCQIFAVGEHNCVMIAPSTRRHITNPATKKSIWDLASKGMKPKRIHDYFFESLGQTEIPTVKSIRNFLSRTKFTYNQEAQVKVGDLIEWLQTNSTIPDGDSEAFVLCSDCSDPLSKDKFFRFAFTSKILLQNATLSDNLHADATYKLIWQGFPVFVLGCTDKMRKFHLIALGVANNEKQADFEFFFDGIKKGILDVFGRVYSPKVLVADAAAAIGNAFGSVFPKHDIISMCYAHVIANVHKKCDKSKWVDIKKDIEYLHMASSAQSFHAAKSLFIQKYEKTDPEFVHYMQTTWFDRNQNWFVGAMLYAPCTNNALEAFNNVLKRDYTERKKLSLAAFKVFLSDIIQTISNKYSGEKKFHSEVVLGSADWRAGVDWLQLKRAKISIDWNQSNQSTVYVPSHQFAEHFDTEFTMKHVKLYKRGNWAHFEDYKRINFSLYVIRLIKDNWRASTCTCTKFMKSYMCKHIVGIAIDEKLVKPPKIANTDIIIRKNKRGRKPHAKRALLID